MLIRVLSFSRGRSNESVNNTGCFVLRQDPWKITLTCFSVPDLELPILLHQLREVLFVSLWLCVRAQFHFISNACSFVYIFFLHGGALGMLSSEGRIWFASIALEWRKTLLNPLPRRYLWSYSDPRGNTDSKEGKMGCCSGRCTLAYYVACNW